MQAVVDSICSLGDAVESKVVDVDRALEVDSGCGREHGVAWVNARRKGVREPQWTFFRLQRCYNEDSEVLQV
jgi:hypothetical protein